MTKDSKKYGGRADKRKNRSGLLAKAPNFLVVGAHKAATGTLFKLLKQHSDIYLPQIKETDFFHDENLFSKGFSWYLEKYFIKADKEKARGEITPDYIFFKQVPQRVRECLGRDVKLIFSLRNPVQRAHSHYWETKSCGLEKLSFEQAVEKEKERLKQGGHFAKRQFGYISKGFYADQIKRYLKFFPRENMYFLLFEEFVQDMPSHTRRILDFLEVDPGAEIDYRVFTHPAWKPRVKLITSFFESSFMRHPFTRKVAAFLVPDPQLRYHIRALNHQPVKRPDLKEETKARLAEVYEEDIKELERITGLDLTLWKQNDK